MITLDDRNITEFGLRVLADHSHPLNTEIQPKTVKVPGKAGVYDFGDELGVKPFSTTFRVIEKDRVQMQQKLYSFVAFLSDENGYPRYFKLIYDYEPDKFYMVKLNGIIDPQRLIGVSSFTFPFIANDPYRYSVVYSDEVTWGSEAITFESSYLLGHEGTAGNVSVGGNTSIALTVSGLAVKPLIMIQGSADSLKLETNGYTISFPKFTSITWEIDCNNYTVLKNGKNSFNDVKLRNFILMPGKNEVQITGTNIDIDINFRYRDKY